MRFILVLCLLPWLAWAQTSAPASQPGALCGDLVVSPSEACDDGNQRSGDGCSASCFVESPASMSEGERLQKLHAAPPKDPAKATRLARRITTIGYVSCALVLPCILPGIPFILFGPSAGHMYAGERRRVWKTAGLRFLGLSMTVTGGVGVGLVGGSFLAIIPGGDDRLLLGGFIASLFLVPGVILLVKSTIKEIKDAPHAVVRFNQAN